MGYVGDEGLAGLLALFNVCRYGVYIFCDLGSCVWYISGYLLGEVTPCVELTDTPELALVCREFVEPALYEQELCGNADDAPLPRCGTDVGK